MGLVGFSNWDMSNFASPSLSSVDQHAFQIEEKAVGLLIASIKSNEVGKDEVHEIKTSLVFRESSDKREELF
jgi:LacI family transcriptional regulator